MKYKFLMAFCLMVLANMVLISEVQAARIPIEYGSKDNIIKIHDLPKTNTYVIRGGRHFDLGYMYKSYEFMWLPIHASQGKVVGYIDDRNYVTLSSSDIDWIVKENKIKNLGSLTKIPFWDMWGGKLIILIIVGLIIASFMKKRDESIDDDSKNIPQ